MNGKRGDTFILQVCRAAIFSLLVFPLSACGGGGGAGLSPLAPGAYSESTPTPTPSPSPAPSPTPTPAPGAITFGAPTFSPSNDGALDCSAATGVAILAIGASATVPITQAQHTGGYTVSVSDATIIAASISGDALSVKSLAAGTATATVHDDAGNSAACVFGVTTANGTVQ